MSAVPFDSLKFAKRLKEAGFTESQAEALASAEVELIEANLATKRDLKELETKLTRDIEALRAEIKRDLKDLENSLIIKLGWMIALAIGTVAALVKIL